MNHSLKIKVITSVLLLGSLNIHAQNKSIPGRFCSINRPEKCWALWHPFIAKKTWKITQEILKVTDSIASVKTLDGDRNGGQVDAFRHAYWMALLTRQTAWRKALKLGRAHEKGNYLDFKKHRLEDGAHPDKASGDMDLFNNKIGIELGKTSKKTSEKELQQIVIDAILAGKMKIIKKDSLGNFLDVKGNIIPADSLQGKWDNGKCIVNSNNK